MTETFAPEAVAIEAAFVSDRGLSEKRPVNEDSCLADVERGLFIVADGVGGAQAGEVASETAVEVLSEAFRFKLDDNDDVEDLMELAIQRANRSIYQMAREHPDLSTMATTVVTLHLKGLQATIGHVGDSRLYRRSPDGRLYRETNDHSVVEEEVRAGRMTPEQAANHPSRNIISRALGAEANVEVDMRTISYESGTTFLLCSDGITRHLSDTEICDLLQSGNQPQQICEEMKRLCYERGAEDNLTAVVVRPGIAAAGAPAAAPIASVSAEEEERTVASPRQDSGETPAQQSPPAPVLAPAAPVEQPAPFAATIQQTEPRSGMLAKLFLTLLVLGGLAGAFFGGMALRDKFAELTGWSIPGSNNATPTPPPSNNFTLDQARSAFVTERSALDANPEEWLKKQDAAGIAAPDAKALYLRGRAYLLLGKPDDAIAEFDKALTKIRNEGTDNSSLKMEVEAARLRAHIDGKAEKPFPQAEILRSLNDLLGLPATKTVSPPTDDIKSDK